MKINYNTCYNCKSNNIIYDEQKTCNDCCIVLANIYVTSNNQKDNYNKYANNMYKRKTYIKVIIKQKLNDLPRHIEEKIINEKTIYCFNLIKLI